MLLATLFLGFLEHIDYILLTDISNKQTTYFTHVTWIQVRRKADDKLPKGNPEFYYKSVYLHYAVCRVVVYKSKGI